MEPSTSSRAEVRRVLLAGDTHGNTRWTCYLGALAAETDCDLIIQVGDFGFFPNLAGGERFLDDVNSGLTGHGVELWFIDGNHDDHGALAAHRGATEPVSIRQHVSYLPRGSRVRLGDVEFAFLGGAFSVDWRDRTVGHDWWPTEAVDRDDVERIGTTPVDVLVTHDAPAGLHLLSGWRLPADDQVRADESRALIAEVVAVIRPRLVFHGHWHHAHDTELGWVDRDATDRTGELTWASTQVTGLGCDGDEAYGWAVLDLTTLQVWRPTPSLSVDV